MASYCSRTCVGKTQVQTIVKEKEEITKKWEACEISCVKYCKPRAAGYEDLDKGCQFLSHSRTG